jgi:hypothetical protein
MQMLQKIMLIVIISSQVISHVSWLKTANVSGTTFVHHPILMMGD